MKPATKHSQKEAAISFLQLAASGRCARHTTRPQGPASAIEGPDIALVHIFRFENETSSSCGT
jgi:hypothetical protein